MTRFMLSVATVIAAAGVFPNMAIGQGWGPRRIATPVGPTVSPYLNLARPGTIPAINYYGLVRPQLETNANLSGLRHGLMSVQSTTGQAAAEGPDGILFTGRSAGFMTQGPYFMTTGGGANPGRMTPVLGSGVRGGTSLPPRLPRPGPR